MISSTCALAGFLTALVVALVPVPHHGGAQSGSNWFYNIDDANLAIDGYDVVAYFVTATLTRGSVEYEVEHDGVR